MKGLGLIVLGGMLVIAAAAAGTYALSEMRLNQKIEVIVPPITVPTDITSIQRGQHLASAVATCPDCHGPNLAGKVLIDDPGLGRIVAPNLTRGGRTASWSSADFVRAIRHGIDPSGRQLLIMPSDAYNTFSDQDLGAIIAYLKSVAPINASLPLGEVRRLGRMLFVLGQVQLQPAANIDRSGQRPIAPQPAVTTEYGKYLADSAGCARCHGPGMSGGSISLGLSSAIPATNITPTGLGGWSDADFIKLMRTGTRPDGRRLDASMPWPYYAQMTDDELRAIWRLLQVLPPRPTGTR